MPGKGIGTPWECCRIDGAVIQNTSAENSEGYKHKQLDPVLILCAFSVKPFYEEIEGEICGKQSRNKPKLIISAADLQEVPEKFGKEIMLTEGQDLRNTYIKQSKDKPGNKKRTEFLNKKASEILTGPVCISAGEEKTGKHKRNDQT